MVITWLQLKKTNSQGAHGLCMNVVHADFGKRYLNPYKLLGSKIVMKRITRLWNTWRKQPVASHSPFWSVTVLKPISINMSCTHIMDTNIIGTSVGIEFNSPRPSLNHQLPRIDAVSQLDLTTKLPQTGSNKPIIHYPDISQRCEELCTFDTPRPTFF